LGDRFGHEHPPEDASELTLALTLKSAAAQESADRLAKEERALKAAREDLDAEVKELDQKLTEVKVQQDVDSSHTSF